MVNVKLSYYLLDAMHKSYAGFVKVIQMFSDLLIHRVGHGFTNKVYPKPGLSLISIRVFK